jgi:hypothetical protein
LADNQLICGLRRQYARTLGFIAAGEDRAEDLAHLAAVIRMFKPDEDLAAIRAVRPYREGRRTWNDAAIRILKASPVAMTARELAERVILAKAASRSDYQSVVCSLHAVLERLEGRGVVRVAEQPKRWTAVL